MPLIAVTPTAPDLLARAVLRVGDGRGFVVERRDHFGHNERIIITAAHCLPRLSPPYEHLLSLPTPHPARYLQEETYQRLLAPLRSECTVWATCLFVDPIADIVVLGQPDNQDLSEQADAYDQLVEDMTVLAIADASPMGVEVVPGREIPIDGRPIKTSSFKAPTPGEAPARVLSLEGQWLDGCVLRRGGRLEFLPHEFFVDGMSGSPIVNAAGAAIGVVSVDTLSPVLVDCLSAQLVRAIKAASHRNRSR